MMWVGSIVGICSTRYRDRMSESTTVKRHAQLSILARDAGVPYYLPAQDDPFKAWIELMEAVEALCPRWPERDRITKGVFLL